MSRRRLALVVGGALALVSCGTAAPTWSGAPGADGGGGSSTAPPAATSLPIAAPPGPDITKRPFTVEHTTRTFVDPSRPTQAGSKTPELPERTLVTEIHRPAEVKGAPLIMFSHGLLGSPTVFTELLDRWAAAGYVVVAPAFPLTSRTVPGAQGNARDLWNQPGDIVFLLDQVLAENAATGKELTGAIDPTRIGAAGLSLGGATTLGLAFNPCCREPRFRAFEVLAGNPIPLPEAYDFADATPVLFLHGDKDASLAIANELDAYRKAKDPKWFVTLLGGSHAPPFEDDDTPYDRYVEDVTTAFWDLKLLPAAGSPGPAPEDAGADATFLTLLEGEPDLATVEPR